MNSADRRSSFLSYLNWFTVEDLSEPAEGWLPAIVNAGYDGVQFLEPPPIPLLTQAVQLGLRVCGSGRVNVPDDAWRLAREAKSLDLECLTLHVGWGHEEDEEAFSLIEAVLEASAATAVPM